jgi:type VI protein secretion system component Hcp
MIFQFGTSMPLLREGAPKMEQVLISSFRQGGGGDFPTEHVSFSPGKIVMTYTQQKRSDGAPGGNVATGWDLTQNKTTV